MVQESTVSCDETVESGEAQAVLTAALHAYVAISSRGCVTAWNPAAEALFGYHWDEVRGRELAELIIPQRLRAAHRAGLRRLAAGGDGRVLGRALRLPAVHRDGHEFPVDVSLTVTDGPDGRVFHAFVLDATTAQRVSRFAAVETAVARGLVEAVSAAAAAVRVVDAVGAQMGWPVAELWLADEPSGLVVCAARYAAANLHLGAFAVDELERGIGLPGRVLQQGRPDWIADLAQDHRSPRSHAAAKIGLHVAVGVPVCGSGRTLGALCVYGDRAEDPEDTLTALLGGIAAQVGQYVERRRAEELAVELAQTKDEFLALVTHELRNPLAVIMATTTLIEEDFDSLQPQDHRQLLRTIGASARRLSVLTDDLLDLARLESGALVMHRVDTDLCEIIGDAVDDVSVLCEQKHLSMAVEIPDRLSLNADPDRLRQVADNLLSNAVKYTPDGGQITVAAQLADGWIEWTVSDSGIGIPVRERERLFRRFYRASTATDRRIPGTGLGLVITRTIIERHDGTIMVADRPGPGTTFLCRLPDS